jgi:hypothetical protein
MLVHSCVDCGRITINRIASDDDACCLHDIYTASLKLVPATHQLLMESGIRLLDDMESSLVQRLMPETSTLVIA